MHPAAVGAGLEIPRRAGGQGCGGKGARGGCALLSWSEGGVARGGVVMRAGQRRGRADGGDKAARKKKGKQGRCV
jgi:hypothetical protein